MYNNIYGEIFKYYNEHAFYRWDEYMDLGKYFFLFILWIFCKLKLI